METKEAIALIEEVRKSVLGWKQKISRKRGLLQSEKLYSMANAQRKADALSHAIAILEKHRDGA